MHTLFMTVTESPEGQAGLQADAPSKEDSQPVQTSSLL